MKKYLLSSVCCVLVFFLHAQNNQWTWTAGENNYIGFNYGTKGVADSLNLPRARGGAATWVDASGDLWLFGYANDNVLWKYSPAIKLWTWVSGDSSKTQPVYGTRGVAAAANTPTGGNQPISWTDAAGKFWLYSSAVLWKYDPLIGQWTWVSGDTSSTNTVYGTKGVAAPTNKPGNQVEVEWTDAAGNFWMYGRVLWKYDVTAGIWTWVHGDTTATTTVYGQRGLSNSSNTPGTRSGITAWTDTAGKFWLFGGTGTVSHPYSYKFRDYYTGPLNDLWKYDPLTNQWTWMHGDTVLYSGGGYRTKGVADPINRPGSRAEAVSWKDAAGNLWMFGGYLENTIIYQLPSVKPLGDLWKYDAATNLWTFFNQNSSFVSRDSFDVKGVENPYTLPATRYSASRWTDRSGNLWMFGGITYDFTNAAYSFLMNDLLKYNPNTNLWSLEQEHKDITQRSTYGKKGVARPVNKPGGRYGAASCTDTAGNVWLFGGFGYPETGAGYYPLGDLWKQDKAKQWTWAGNLTSDNYNGRLHAQMWVDAANKIWIYGGAYPGGNGSNLWKVDPFTYQSTPVSSTGFYYGVKGQPAATNGPGARNNAVTWTDKAGKLWMFGGDASSIAYRGRQKNDVWNYNPATGWWTWISGDSTFGQPAVFGNRGIANATNKPGGRLGAASWTDTSGNIWVFGGYREDSTFLSDLWKYNPATNQWTWMHGDSTTNCSSVYGTKGAANAINKPGGRYDAVAWIDPLGKMWLFGGAAKGHNYNTYSPQTTFSLNDLWCYDPVISAWTWISGDSTVDQYGWYGRLGVADAGNKPGSRSGAVGYTDKAGNFGMIGGQGYGWKGNSLLNDEWTFSPFSATALPVRFFSFSATAQGREALLQWRTSAAQDKAYYIVERSRDGVGYDSIAMVRAATGSPSATNGYLFTDYNPFTETNYYRIKQLDPDGRFTYSKIVRLRFEQAGWSYVLVPNPVHDELKVSFGSNRAVTMQLGVRDAAGHLLISRQQQVNSGSSVYTVPVKNLATGTYFLSVAVGKITSTKKFVKQ